MRLKSTANVCTVPSHHETQEPLTVEALLVRHLQIFAWVTTLMESRPLNETWRRLKLLILRNRLSCPLQGHGSKTLSICGRQVKKNKFESGWKLFGDSGVSLSANLTCGPWRSLELGSLKPARPSKWKLSEREKHGYPRINVLRLCNCLWLALADDLLS